MNDIFKEMPEEYTALLAVYKMIAELPDYIVEYLDKCINHYGTQEDLSFNISFLSITSSFVPRIMWLWSHAVQINTTNTLTNFSIS